MELWHAWNCPRCMRVRTVLAEKGLPYRARELEPGERVPIPLDENQAGTLPVLVHEDVVLVGPTAIVSWLCARWPEPPLLDVGGGRDRVLALCARIDGLFEPHLRRIDQGTPGERVAALGEVRRAMAGIDAELEGSPCLLPAYSLADITLASWMARLPRDWRPAQLGLERLARWERTVMARPCIREQMGPRLPGIPGRAR